jgi:hypothetical protein
MVWGRSVKDIAGVFNNPRWAEEVKGVMLDLTTMGPSGELVDELGRQILAEEKSDPPQSPLIGGKSKLNVGFSADVIFTAKGREVQKIMRVLEVCLVYNPARGGAFVRALNSTFPDGAWAFPRGAWERENSSGGVRMAEGEIFTSNTSNTPNPPQGGSGLGNPLQDQMNVTFRLFVTCWLCKRNARGWRKRRKQRELCACRCAATC